MTCLPCYLVFLVLLLAGKVVVDVILHQACRVLLGESIGQKACWACIDADVSFRRLISLTGWDRCKHIVSVIAVFHVAGEQGAHMGIYMHVQTCLVLCRRLCQSRQRCRAYEMICQPCSRLPLLCGLSCDRC